MLKITRYLLIIITLAFIFHGCEIIYPEQNNEALLPRIGYFFVDPANIKPGQQIALEWETNGATEITIDPIVGKVPALGTIKVTPDKTTTYTLTARNKYNFSTKTATVTVSELEKPQAVPPKITYFRVKPNYVTAGTAVSLSWDVVNASSIIIECDGCSKATFSEPQGETILRPVFDTVYIIKALNQYGVSIISAEVVIKNDPSYGSEESGISSCG